MSTESEQAGLEPAEEGGEMAEGLPEGEIRISGGGEQVVRGEHVAIHQGGAQRIESEHVEIRQGGAQFIEAQTVTMDHSGAISLKAQQVRMVGSGAGILTSDHVDLQADSSAGVIIAKRVDGPSINTRLLLASEVYGNVETTVDARGAVVMGLGLGIGLGLILWLGSLFTSED